MAEKIKLTQEMLDSGKSFEELGFKIMENPLPYSELEEIALEFMENAFVIDPLGIVYENYTYDLEWVYMVLKYFSNLDVEGWDKETLYGFVRVHRNNMCTYGVTVLQLMIDRMASILEKRVKRENSLDYKLGQLVDSLKDMNVQQTNEATEKIISLMDKVNEAEKKPVLTMFAKKDDRS